MNENEIKTGLEFVEAENRHAAEEDILKGLLKAADFRNDEDMITPLEIRRGNKTVLTFRVRPLSDNDTETARKKTTKYLPNPAGRKYPKIEGERDTDNYHNWLIYLATVDEDRKKIWENQTFMSQKNLFEGFESVGVVLMAGEKLAIVEKLLEISGINEDVEAEEYAKN